MAPRLSSAACAAVEAPCLSASRDSAGIRRASASEATTTGTIASIPPTSPSQRTSSPVTNAPSAYPALPPMLKYDMPLARLGPLA